MSTRDRLLSGIEIADNGCWLWQRAISDCGYGRIGFDRGKRTCQAHRVSYEEFVGPIPDGLDVDHLCHNTDPTCSGGPSCLHRRCINPEHLEPATEQENTLRSQHALASINSRKTHCIHGHEFTPENTVRNGKGRKCRTCGRKAQRESKRRMRAA